ncbi:MAG: mechanosensitive ion channel [Pirellulales bacterium]
MDQTPVTQQFSWDQVMALLAQLQGLLREFVLANGMNWLSRIVPALAVFWIGQWGANVVVQAAGRAMERARLDETLAKFLCRITYAALMCAVALASLRNLGVDTSSLTAILAAGGLAIGLALQGSLSNFAAGIMIIVFRPFRVGDMIEAGGAKGIVEEITIFYTLMRTPDNIQLIVPNGAITGGNITNYSMKPTRRVDLTVSCAYDDDLRQVRAFLEELLRSDPRILADPAPVVAVDELADHSVNFVVRPWVRNTDYWQVRWNLIEQIKIGFDDRGFSIPFPQRDVHVYHENVGPQDATAPAAPAKPEDDAGIFYSWPAGNLGAMRPRRAA